jgi:hypothetical protein
MINSSENKNATVIPLLPHTFSQHSAQLIKQGYNFLGHTVARVRRYATNGKVAGSIPHAVTVFFN